MNKKDFGGAAFAALQNLQPGNTVPGADKDKEIELLRLQLAEKERQLKNLTAPKKERKTERINILVTPTTALEAKQRAQEARLSLNEYINRAIIKAVKGEAENG